MFNYLRLECFCLCGEPTHSDGQDLVSIGQAHAPRHDRLGGVEDVLIVADENFGHLDGHQFADAIEVDHFEHVDCRRKDGREVEWNGGGEAEDGEDVAEHQRGVATLVQRGDQHEIDRTHHQHPMDQALLEYSLLVTILDRPQGCDQILVEFLRSVRDEHPDQGVPIETFGQEDNLRD